MLIWVLAGVGAVLALATGVVALTTLRPQEKTDEPLSSPFSSSSAGAATIAPAVDQTPSAAASETAKVVDTPPTPVTVTRRTTTSSTGGKTATVATGADACTQCASLAASNIPAAAAAYRNCTDPAQKQRCAMMVRSLACDAARRAAFNGNCPQAQAIAAAARQVGGNADACAKSGSCK